jgi:hypothetical protein
LAKILVSCSCIQWPRLMLCSATPDFSGWYTQMCQWCSLTLISIKHPVCPMYTLHTCSECCMHLVFLGPGHP